MRRGWARCLVVVALVVAVVAAGSCGAGEDPALEPPGGPPQQSAAAVSDACSLVPADAVGTALSVSPGSLSTEAQPFEPSRGATCRYVDGGTRRVLFVVQMQEPADAAQARHQVLRAGGIPVTGVGDAAQYEQTPLGPSHLAFAKGRRVVRLLSQSGPVGQQAMVDLAKHAAAKV